MLTLEPTHGLNHLGFKVTDAGRPRPLPGATRGRRRRRQAVRARTSGRPATARSIRFDAAQRSRRWSWSTACSRWATCSRRPTRRRGRWAWSAWRRRGSDHIFLTAEEVDTVTTFLVEHLDFRLTEQVRRRRRLPDRHLARGLAHLARHRPDHRPERRAAPLRVLGGRLERPAHRRRRLRLPRRHASRRTPPGTAPRAVSASTSSTRSATATRCSPAATGSTPDAEPITWTEAEMGRALFYYDGVVNQKFLTVHTERRRRPSTSRRPRACRAPSGPTRRPTSAAPAAARGPAGRARRRGRRGASGTRTRSTCGGSATGGRSTAAPGRHGHLRRREPRHHAGPGRR